jgi:hypothetical protein
MDLSAPQKEVEGDGDGKADQHTLPLDARFEVSHDYSLLGKRLTDGD